MLFPTGEWEHRLERTICRFNSGSSSASAFSALPIKGNRSTSGLKLFYRYILYLNRSSYTMVNNIGVQSEVGLSPGLSGLLPGAPASSPAHFHDSQMFSAKPRTKLKLFD
jgi:hypothetical protein